MLNKTKGKKTEAASFKAVVASVTKKMAQPRVAESAKLRPQFGTCATAAKRSPIRWETEKIWDS